MRQLICFGFLNMNCWFAIWKKPPQKALPLWMFFLLFQWVKELHLSEFWMIKMKTGIKRGTGRCWSLWRTSVGDLRPHQLQRVSSKCSSKASAKPSLLALQCKCYAPLQSCQFSTLFSKFTLVYAFAAILHLLWQPRAEGPHLHTWRDKPNSPVTEAARKAAVSVENQKGIWGIMGWIGRR